MGHQDVNIDVYLTTYLSQTFYIYFGVAAFIGLLTGAILYFFSLMLVSIFDMDGPSIETRHSTESVGGRRQGRRLENEPQISGITARNDPLAWYGEASKKDNTEYLDQGRGGERGLLSQIILEEDSEGSRL
jgi:hypothetical protein